MWIILGTVILTFILSYLLYKRMYPHWKGEHLNLDEISYEYKVKALSFMAPDKASGILLGLVCTKGSDFNLVPEKVNHRLFKRIGIMKENQTGDKEFDRKIYNMSDNITFNNFLCQNEKVRKCILKFFENSENHGLSLENVRLSNNKLWVEYKTYDDDLKVDRYKQESFKKQFIKEIGLLLVEIKNEIELNQLEYVKKDSFFVYTIPLLSLCSLFVVYPLLYFFYENHPLVPFNLEYFIYEPLFTGILAITMLFYFTSFLLKKNPRIGYILAEVTILGTLGAIATSYSFYSDMNKSLDSSIAIKHKTKVIEKFVVRTSKNTGKFGETNRTEYFVDVENWLNKNEEPIHIRISQNLLYSLSVGENMQIYQRDGYFSKKWVEKIEAINK